MADEKDDRAFIGGSDVACLVGVPTFKGKTPFSVWARIKGYADRGAPATDEMRHGLALEPYVLDALEKGEPGVEALERLGTVMVRNPSLPAFVGGHPDGRCRYKGAKALVEAKTAGYPQRHKWGKPYTDQFPENYVCQVAWYMALEDAEIALVPVLIGGQDFRVYRMERDRDLEKALIDRVGEWWETYIVGDAEPDPMGPAVTPYLRKRFPLASEEMRAALPAEADLLRSYLRADAALKLAEDKKEEVGNLLKLAIGPKLGILAEDAKAIWSNVSGRRVIGWEALARSLGATPEQIERFTTKSEPSRRLRVIGDGE